MSSEAARSLVVSTAVAAAVLLLAGSAQGLQAAKPVPPPRPPRPRAPPAAPQAPSGAIRTGFDANSYGANDDGTYPCVGTDDGVPSGCTPSEISLPFSIDFFGTSYDSLLFVNNNGNVTFGSALGTFTPYPLSSRRARRSSPPSSPTSTPRHRMRRRPLRLGNRRRPLRLGRERGRESAAYSGDHERPELLPGHPHRPFRHRSRRLRHRVRLRQHRVGLGSGERRGRELPGRNSGPRRVRERLGRDRKLLRDLGLRCERRLSRLDDGDGPHRQQLRRRRSARPVRLPVPQRTAAHDQRRSPQSHRHREQQEQIGQKQPDLQPRKACELRKRRLLALVHGRGHTWTTDLRSTSSGRTTRSRPRARGSSATAGPRRTTCT